MFLHFKDQPIFVQAFGGAHMIDGQEGAALYKAVFSALLADPQFIALIDARTERTIELVIDRLVAVMLHLGDAIVQHPEFEAIQRRSVEMMIEHSIEKFDRLLNDTLLTQSQAAEFLGINRATLSKLHGKKKGPNSRGKGRWLRYTRGDLLTWQAKQGS